MKEIHGATHRTIKKVTQDIEERFHFNTAISSIMELVNALYQFHLPDGEGKGTGLKVFREAVDAVVHLISPFAPHISEELWIKLGNTVPVYKTPWPGVNDNALVREEVTLIVQINGKVRSKINAPADSAEEFVRGLVMKDEKTLEWVKDKTIKKFIYVPNRIVNMVVS